MKSKKFNIKQLTKQRADLIKEMRKLQRMSNKAFDEALNEIGQLSDESDFSSGLMKLLDANNSYRQEITRLLEKLP